MMRAVLILVFSMISLLSSQVHALDPLRIDERISVIHLSEFIREIEGQRAFAVQNASDGPLVFELQRYPTQWPLASFLNIEKRPVAPLRLIMSDGKEVAADWRSPDQLIFSIPSLSVQSFAFEGYMGPVRHLWLWGENSRISFERNSRLIWLVIFAFVGFAWSVGFLRRLVNKFNFGLPTILLEALTWGAAGFCLKAGAVLPTGLKFHTSDALLLSILIGALVFHGLNWWRYYNLSSPLRGYWLTLRVFADLSILMAFGLWGFAVMNGPFMGYITLDLFPLALFMTSLILSLGVLFSPQPTVFDPLESVS